MRMRVHALYSPELDVRKSCAMDVMVMCISFHDRRSVKTLLPLQTVLQVYCTCKYTHLFSDKNVLVIGLQSAQNDLLKSH